MSTITTINSTDVVANSRATINTNFTNLNDDKIEGPSTTVDGNVAAFNGTDGTLLKGTLLNISSSGSFFGNFSFGGLTGNQTYGFPDVTGDIILRHQTISITNKTINLADNTISGTIAEFNTALSDGSFATLAGGETLTNKIFSLGSNTVSGTTAQFNSALSDGDFATLAGTETLTNKTLTTPRISNDILDNSGNTSIRIGATGSAVEYLFITNGVAGGTVSVGSSAAFFLFSSGDGQPITLDTSDGTTNSSTGGNLVATLGNASTSGGNALGGRFTFTAGNGFGTGAGGSFTLTCGNGGATGQGGNVNLTAGNGGATSGAGGGINLTAGNGTAGSANGGQVTLRGGAKASGGTDGYVKIVDPTSLIAAIFSTASLASSDKTFTFPNESGTILTSATTSISTTSLTGTGTVTLVSGTAAASTAFSVGLNGSTNTQYRISVPANTTALTADTSYAAMFFRGSVIEATSGTHPLLCTLGLKALTVTTGAATVTDTALVYLEGPATATVTGINYTLWVDDGPSRFDGRILGAKGSDLTAAGDLTLGNDGNFWDVTGTTTINAITTAGWTAGSRITLKFEASVTVKHNTAGGAGTATMLLAGAADFSATANDTLSLLYDGTNWLEVGRAVI